MLKLKANPTFKATVKIPAPGGESFDVEFTFRHKTRAGLHTFLFDDHPNRGDVDAVLEIAEAWAGVDGDFGRESLEVMFQEYHAAAGEIVRAYAQELTQARAKN